MTRVEAAFRKFHAENPHVADGLENLAVQALNRGLASYGMKALIEVFRWQSHERTNDRTYKINNNHAPYYARLIMEREPRLYGFFETRSTRREKMDPGIALALDLADEGGNE